MKVSEYAKFIGTVATVEKSFEYGRDMTTFNVVIRDVDVDRYDTKYLIEPVSGGVALWVNAHCVTLPTDKEEGHE